MPTNYDYKIKKCELKDQYEDNLKFELEMRIGVKTEGEVKQYLALMNKKQDALSTFKVVGQTGGKLEGKVCPNIEGSGNVE